MRGGGAGGGTRIGSGAGTGAGAGTRTGAGTGAAAWTGAGAATGAGAGAGAGTGAGAGCTGTSALGAGATTCLGVTTFWLRLGRELTEGRMLNASEITSATTPTVKMITTLIAAKNGLRVGCSGPAMVKSGYMPVVKSSSSTSA